MLVEGLTLAGLSFAGFYMIFTKVPRRIRKFLLKHTLLTDILACVGTYALLGGTLTALYASALVGLSVSILLSLMGNPDTAAALEGVMKRLAGWKNAIFGAIAKLAKKEETPQLKAV